MPTVRPAALVGGSAASAAIGMIGSCKSVIDAR